VLDRHDPSTSSRCCTRRTEVPDPRTRRGHSAGEREAIEAALSSGPHMLVVQRTGWVKSLAYWIGARVRRDVGQGPT
jgi:superfamily II DNA helicase RecQ